LYYEYQRWYDPSIGRFISPDPKHGHLSNPQSLNLYIYVMDQPTSLTDPTGLDACGWNPLSWGGCVNNATQAASNWWNSQDQTTKLAIIAVVATVAIVATAGLAAPALLPLIATGIAIGAGTSAASYAAATMASGGTITAKGLLTSIAIGGFFGAVSFGTYGAVAGAAAGVGLSSAATFALGAAASFAATSAIQGITDSSSPADLSQLGSNYAAATSNRITAMSQASSNPNCSAAVQPVVTAVFMGGFLMTASTWAFHVGGRANTVGYVLLGAGFVFVGAGLGYALSQCS
jgi:hypothetical protein